jgi:hypothetical protein
LTKGVCTAACCCCCCSCNSPASICLLLSSKSAAVPCTINQGRSNKAADFILSAKRANQLLFGIVTQARHVLAPACASKLHMLRRLQAVHLKRLYPDISYLSVAVLLSPMLQGRWNVGFNLLPFPKQSCLCEVLQVAPHLLPCCCHCICCLWRRR